MEYLSYREAGQVVWKSSVRGPLEGAGSWTHQYADPHNTACSGDELVSGPLGILWFGEPGPQGMVERHAAVQAPVALDGRLYIQGENTSGLAWFTARVVRQRIPAPCCVS